MNFPYINQILFNHNQIVPIERNKFIISNCTVKIIINVNEVASGFLLKFIRNNNKPFYCLMTNEHVITDDLVQSKKEISIINEDAKIKLFLKLDEEDRIIKCFKEILNIDISLVEIIPKDKIDVSHFLTPNTNYSQLGQINQYIQVAQYPSGGPLSFSEGKILGFHCEKGHYFYHNASTEFGSSGGPIVLKGDHKVFGIHKGATSDRRYNIGIFIGNIIEIMKEYKRQGKFKEFYINGNLKYEENPNNIESLENQINITSGEEKKQQDNKSINNFFETLQKLNWKDTLEKAADALHPLGNALGVRCTRCGHYSGDHDKIEKGTYFCNQCNDLCKIIC